MDPNVDLGVFVLTRKACELDSKAAAIRGNSGEWWFLTQSFLHPGKESEYEGLETPLRGYDHIAKAQTETSTEEAWRLHPDDFHLPCPRQHVEERDRSRQAAGGQRAHHLLPYPGRVDAELSWLWATLFRCDLCFQSEIK